MSIGSGDSIRSGSRSNSKISNKNKRHISVNGSSSYGGACNDDWETVVVTIEALELMMSLTAVPGIIINNNNGQQTK